MANPSGVFSLLDTNTNSQPALDERGGSCEFVLRAYSMRASSLKISISAVVIFALSLAGCTRRPEGNATAAAPPDEKIRIGAFMSLTGDTGHYGISAHNGMKLAVEEVNARGGVGGRRIDLIVRDTRSDADETRAVVESLVNENRVHALLGEIVSSRSLAAAPIAQASGVPMLTPTATNSEVTKQGDYIFRSCYTDPFQGAAIAQFAERALNARRAAVLHDESQAYSVELAKLISDEFVRRGGQLVFERAYGEGESDFGEALAAINEAAPDVIFVPGYYLEAGLLARQAEKAGVSAPLVGGDGWDSPRLYEIGGQALVGDFYSSHFSARDPAPRVRRFVEEYVRFYGSEPDAFAAASYDAARIMISAIERAPSLDHAAIRDSLAATADFPGVTGDVTFDVNRNALKPVVLIRIGDHGANTVAQHVTPEMLAPQPAPTPSPTPKKKRRRRAR